MNALLSCATLGASVVLLASSAANALVFDYRFVERVGTTDFVLPGTTYNATPGTPVRLRIQFLVRDDGIGPAPAGGFVSWTNGTITDSLAAHNTRTPGRLTPFNFSANGDGQPPVPTGEPFQMLTQINADFLEQNLIWLNDPNGNPLPMPQPQVRGLGAFVSVFEFTTTPGSTNYTITVGGDLTAASSWNLVTSTPPNTNPGSVQYQPVTLPPQSFLLPPLVLTIHVPAPATCVPLAGLAAITLSRRRRR